MDAVMWWSRRRGIHDAIAHAGWCADQSECEPVSPDRTTSAEDDTDG